MMKHGSPRWRCLGSASLFVLPLILPHSSIAQGTPVPKSGAPFAKSTVLVLHNGTNALDLVGDGKQAMVFAARRENFNAHGYSSVAFYVHAAAADGPGLEWHLVPFFGGPTDIDVFRTAEGADCTLADLRVFRARAGGPVSVILAEREPGESFADAAPLRFDVYRLEKNRQGIAGWPLYYFQWERDIRPERPYCDVNEAFAQELGLGKAGLGRGEGGR